MQTLHFNLFKIKISFATVVFLLTLTHAVTIITLFAHRTEKEEEIYREKYTQGKQGNRLLNTTDGTQASYDRKYDEHNFD